MFNTKFIQVCILSGFCCVAVLDCSKAGQYQFWNPLIDGLPWQNEAVSLFSTTCKRDQVVSLDKVSTLIPMIKMPNPSYVNFEHLLGAPDCTTEDDQKNPVYRWNLKETYIHQDLSLRVKFSKASGLMISADVLK